MDVINWDENFVTGLPEVDKQHHYLVDLTNQFGNLLSQDQLTAETINTLFSEICSYTDYHFKTEEGAMQKAGIHPTHLSIHHQEHQSFLEEVLQLRNEVETERGTKLNDLYKFLMNWLVYHILGTDMNMARQVKAIEQGHSAARALTSVEKQTPSANRLLLKVLDNLFQQVSQRNKQLVNFAQDLEEKVVERTQELTEANHKLKQLATTDSLTGLPNRRYAMQLLQRLWDEARAATRPLACLLLDADGFKQVNDSCGHDAGDIVLRDLSRELQHNVRTDDVVCRLGGDEFLIICPNTDRDGALLVAQQLRERIATLRIEVPGGFWMGSLSVGVGAKTALMKGPEDLIKLADRGVYAAKDAGKNCVRIID